MISSVLPFFFYTKGLSFVENGKASILAGIEPVVAALTGVIVFGEALNLPILTGLSCILTAI